jgi:2C-methyl-D-erythritol 2,4-cyclodiphosphate synthase
MADAVFLVRLAQAEAELGAPHQVTKAFLLGPKEYGYVATVAGHEPADAVDRAVADAILSRTGLFSPKAA